MLSGDCDDANPTVYPGAAPTHQGLDNNCDGVLICAEKPPCLADFNSDCGRNITDLLLFMSHFGCVSGCGIYDLNGDGVVNTTDLLIFMSAFGTTCP